MVSVSNTAHVEQTASGLATYSNTDGHAQATHESVHARSHRTVLLLGNGLVGDGLRCDVDALQHHAVTHAEHGEGESEDRLLGALVRQGEQAADDKRDAPAQPDGLSKAPDARGEDSHDDGRRGRDRHPHG
jgi:hypothetical protein